MLEIIMVVWATKKLSKMATRKGRSAGFAVLGPVLWIGGEILGFAIGFASGLHMGAYVLGILMAAAGMGAAFIVISRLSSAEGYDPLGHELTGWQEDLSEHQDPQNPYSPPRKV